MIPTNPAEAPSIDHGVLRRLRELDPSLTVTWSPWALDVKTGRPIVGTGAMDPLTGDRAIGPTFNPLFYLWRKSDTCTHHFLVSVYEQFGHREVLSLERDVARFMRPEDIFRTFEARAAERRLAERAEYADRHQQISKANAARIGDLVFGNATGERDSKIVSYGGQKNRSTPGRVLADAKDDGWELPDPE